MWQSLINIKNKSENTTYWLWYKNMSMMRSRPFGWLKNTNRLQWISHVRCCRDCKADPKVWNSKLRFLNYIFLEAKCIIKIILTIIPCWSWVVMFLKTHANGKTILCLRLLWHTCHIHVTYLSLSLWHSGWHMCRDFG